MTTHLNIATPDAEANAIAQELLNAMSGKPHAQCIHALEMLATVMAMRYPCCTADALTGLEMSAAALKDLMRQNPLMYTPTNPTTH